MKKMKRLAAMTLLAAFALNVAPAFAQPEEGAPPPPPHEGPHGGPGGPGRFMEEADANKDGFLTKDEMRTAQEKKLDEMFAKTDTDKDGKLSKEELKAGREAMRAKMQERFKQRKEMNSEK